MIQFSLKSPGFQESAGGSDRSCFYKGEEHSQVSFQMRAGEILPREAQEGLEQSLVKKEIQKSQK